MRDNVKVLIGGATVSDEYAQEIGTAFYCIDGFDGVSKLDFIAA